MWIYEKTESESRDINDDRNASTAVSQSATNSDTSKDRPHRLRKTRSIAVETSQSDSIMGQARKIHLSYEHHATKDIIALSTIVTLIASLLSFLLAKIKTTIYRRKRIATVTRTEMLPDSSIRVSSAITLSKSIGFGA